MIATVLGLALLSLFDGRLLRRIQVPCPVISARSHLRIGGATGAFALVNRETTMPFSLSSYLLGVGTVVGALAFGFGGGVLLTKTAMKDTPVAETRAERVKRADSPSAAPRPVETVDTRAMAAPPPPAEPAPPLAAPASPVQASTDLPKAESAQPIAEVPKQPIAEAPRPVQSATAAESSPQTALANREEPRFNSLDTPLFGRSREFSPIDRED